MKELIKKIAAIALAFVSAIAATAAFGAVNAPADASIGRCTVKIYEIGGVVVHAFATNDPLLDECFIFEGRDSLVGLEAPAFIEDLEAWRDYIRSLEKPMRDIIIDVHPTGGRYTQDMRVWSTYGAARSIAEGKTMTTINRMRDQFEGLDRSEVAITDFITREQMVIGGIAFRFVDYGDDFDVFVPRMRAVYTHMFGADTHSLITSVADADILIGRARMYAEESVALILSSHHEPELADAIGRKIGYLENAKEQIEDSVDGDEYRERMRRFYPRHLGGNLLDISSAMIFQ